MRFVSSNKLRVFLDVLAASGTDFGLMHEFIPMRSRAELKKKFNREEKANLRRVNEVIKILLFCTFTF
jgi:hypothetical protein